MNASEIANHLDTSRPALKAGALKFWGNWFGRPYDNCHRLMSCRAADSLLTLQFDQGEALLITNPECLTVSDGLFSIRSATRVRWEWFKYGQPQTLANLCFEDYFNEGTKIIESTNVDWYVPKFTTSVFENAVEMV